MSDTTEQERDWIIDFYSRKLNRALSEMAKNSIYMMRCRLGTVYLNLDDFFARLRQHEHIMDDIVKITRVEIYQEGRPLYDLDFYNIEVNRLLVDQDLEESTLTKLWNQPINPKYIYPLMIFSNLAPPFTVYITYFIDNEFSTREELNPRCLLLI